MYVRYIRYGFQKKYRLKRVRRSLRNVPSGRKLIRRLDEKFIFIHKRATMYVVD